ncbi:MAG: TolC family protein, partial [Calditrichaeota bacterium]|nr:TolC family protein [Calditrichota bacterium]
SKRKAVGGGKAMNYGQALVDYQSDSIRVLAQESRIASLKIDLNAVLNNQLEADIRLIDSGFRQFNPVSKEEILKSVEAANSQLEQQRLMELIAETEIRMALGDAFPKIDIYAGYQYSKSTATVGFSNSNQSYGPTFGITISFNLYNGGETNRAIKNSELYSSNSKLTKEEVEQDIHSNVLILYTDFNSISQQINLAKSNVEEMTKVYQTAEEQLKRGAINGYDFRLTQQMLLNSELTLKQLQFSLKMIEINLNRLSGHILDLYL